MRIIFFTITLQWFLITTPVQSQNPYPDLSYDATIIAKAGFTNFKITYGRPLQRGRTLFGAFIPFDTIWRAGANGTTKISFDTPVTVENTTIEPGTYALLTVPHTAEWEIILHKDTTMFTQRRDYLASEEVAHFSVKVGRIDQHHEAFTIFTDIKNNNLVLNLVWDFTRVSFILQTKATETVLTSLRSKIKNAQLNTADDFAYGADFLAYNYVYLDPEAKDTALLLINKAIELDSAEGWYYRIKRNIFWFSQDLDGIEKSTNDWIAFHERRKSEGDAEIIQSLKNELVWFKNTLHNK